MPSFDQVLVATFLVVLLFDGCYGVPGHITEIDDDAWCVGETDDDISDPYRRVPGHITEIDDDAWCAGETVDDTSDPCRGVPGYIDGLSKMYPSLYDGIEDMERRRRLLMSEVTDYGIFIVARAWMDPFFTNIGFDGNHVRPSMVDFINDNVDYSGKIHMKEWIGSASQHSSDFIFEALFKVITNVDGVGDTFTTWIDTHIANPVHALHAKALRNLFWTVAISITEVEAICEPMDIHARVRCYIIMDDYYHDNKRV